MKRIILFTYFFLLVAGMAPAHAKDDFSLDSYSCAQFLQDAAKPSDGRVLLRSMMMIAWATGYATAHQVKVVRADAKAMQLMAATLGDACRQAPDKTTVHAIVDAISKAIK